MTLPAPRKRRALKNAWLKRWYKAALYPAESREGSVAMRYAPAPRPRNMYASCEIVENARTLLMSKFTTAIVAAKIVVKPPIAAITRIAVNGGATRGERGTRKMDAPAVREKPALTIVAAWVKALTVVRPSMSSGRQPCPGD